MNDNNDITFAEIRQILAETARRQEKAEQEMQESSMRFKEEMQESRMRHDREMQEIREIQKATDQKLEKVSEKIELVSKNIDRTNKTLESFGIVQSEIAEDFCRRSVRLLLEREHIQVDDVIYNMKMNNVRQYDIVAVNGSEAIVFEIKNKLRFKDIDKLMNVQLPDFKKCFPQYKDYKIYGGLGSLVVKENLEKLARKKGLFVLTQGGDGAAELHVPHKRGVW